MQREVGSFVSSVRVKLHYTSSLRHIAKGTLNMANTNITIEFTDTSMINVYFLSKNITLFNIIIIKINILSRFSLYTIIF